MTYKRIGILLWMVTLIVPAIAAPIITARQPFNTSSGAFNVYNPSSTWAENETDLGCCVFMTPQPKCTATNKTYCENRAKQGNLKYTFYPNVNCKQVAECK
ncbi:MAG: hypothetical protein HY080_02750 [Gammaproteobacteria bacterium]|nr:hypothetical protein [Gammaproteobacteria bacterium]